MPTRKFTGPHRQAMPRYRNIKLPDHFQAAPSKPPVTTERFAGLSDKEKQLWPALKRLVTDASGCMFEANGSLIDTLSVALEPHGVKEAGQVTELVNHLSSAGKLHKLAWGGKLRGIAFPGHESQLQELAA